MIVHVVSWSPSAVSDGGLGGFKWNRHRGDALSMMRRVIDAYSDSDYTNITLCVLDVPVDTDIQHDQDLVNERITSWIDQNLHLIEPSLP